MGFQSCCFAPPPSPLEVEGQMCALINKRTPRVSWDKSGGDKSGGNRSPLKAPRENYTTLPEDEERYMVVEDDVLGVGGSSKVFRGRVIKSGLEIAVKKISMGGEKGCMDNEVAVMRKMVHPFIVSMVDTFRCGKFGYIIMSVADGGDLLDRIIDVGFSEAGAACVTRQILQALAYMHSLGIAHRDVKPENCLFLSKDSSSRLYNRIKLCDFGMSTLESSEELVYQDLLKASLGTRNFSAPEMFEIVLGSNNRKSYSAKVDLWAVGVVLYTMLTQTFPFPPNGTMIGILEEMYAFGRYARPKGLVKTSLSAADCICSLMTVDSSERPTAKQALDHPFLLRELCVDTVHNMLSSV